MSGVGGLMSWVKHSDKLWSDPKFQKLSDGAQALWYRADSYIADHLLDGMMPGNSIKMLNTRARYVQELIESGFWCRLESGELLARDWQERIQSRDQVLARRSETLRRVRAHRNGVTNSVSNASPGPGPISSSKEELNSTASFSSSTGQNAREVSPDPILGPTAELVSSRKPLPPEPPELKPPVAVEPSPLPELVVWKKYEELLGKKPGELGIQGVDLRPCQAIAGRVAAHVGGSFGVAFEKATERLLRAWLEDTWVAKMRPGIRDLASRPDKYDFPATSTTGVVSSTRLSQLTRKPDWMTQERFEGVQAIAAEMDEAAGWWAK